MKNIFIALIVMLALTGCGKKEPSTEQQIENIRKNAGGHGFPEMDFSKAVYKPKHKQADGGDEQQKPAQKKP